MPNRPDNLTVITHKTVAVLTTQPKKRSEWIEAIGEIIRLYRGCLRGAPRARRGVKHGSSST